MKHTTLRSFTFILVAFMLGCNEFMVVGVLSDIARSYHVPTFNSWFFGDSLCRSLCD